MNGLTNGRTLETTHAAVLQALMVYDVVIGLEVHCQLATRSKIFSASANSFGDDPNTNLDPTCVGLPGALPVLNDACVDLALRMGLATQCEIPHRSLFERKNYFYPDLPKGYQITQLHHPICRNGHITLSNGKSVRIDRIQLEEDAGKNVHLGSHSLCDYNRSGVGLIEIVSHPDLETPEDAAEYLRRLHALAVHLGVSEGDMERGHFRADANVSLKPKGSSVLGQRTETKNVNSFRFLERAIVREIERQFEILQAGGRVEMETRGFDPDADRGFSQRSKEEAHDYRYFPDPDLPPLFVTPERVERVRASMPELPDARCKRYVSAWGLSEKDAHWLAHTRAPAVWFDTVIARLPKGVEPRVVVSFLQSDVLRVQREEADKRGVSVEDLTEMAVSPESALGLFALIGDGTVSLRMAKDVFAEMFTSGRAAADIVREKGLVQVSDEHAIAEAVLRVLDANPQRVGEYFAGKEKMIAFFVGQTMKKTQGRAEPQSTNKLIADKLSS